MLCPNPSHTGIPPDMENNGWASLEGGGPYERWDCPECRTEVYVGD